MNKKSLVATRPVLAGEALVAMLVAAGHLVQDLDRACQKHGITHDQYNVLRILRGVSPQGHPRGEIATRLISRAPDVTRLLDRLVHRDLVRRGWEPTNRRLSIATITEKGLSLLSDIDQLILHEHARYAHNLTDGELAMLRGLCQRIRPEPTS